jgi:GntR family transcriptional regulator, transcriptional repressor for pyruvate dehydrogenase complex
MNWYSHCCSYREAIMNGSSRLQPKKYLYNKVVELLQQMIARGELKVGDKLPPERTLAQTFQVSRNCVRQAIQALAERHIVESRRGDGTYVCAPDRSLLVGSFSMAIQMKRDLLRDVMEFRKLLEPQIAELAAKRINRQELDRLKIIVCDQERRLMAGEDDAELDAAFHDLLAQASGNKVIKDVAGTLSGIINESRSDTFQSPARKRSSVIAHLRIIDALEKRDGEEAQRAMMEHLLQVEDIILDEMPKQGRSQEPKLGMEQDNSRLSSSAPKDMPAAVNDHPTRSEKSHDRQKLRN